MTRARMSGFVHFHSLLPSRVATRPERTGRAIAVLRNKGFLHDIPIGDAKTYVEQNMIDKAEALTGDTLLRGRFTLNPRLLVWIDGTQSVLYFVSCEDERDLVPLKMMLFG